jgi:hypothetical protein
MDAMSNNDPAKKWIVSAATAALFGVLCACGGSASSRGSFERVITVDGPAELSFSNSNGHAIIHPGPDGQVKVHADFEVRGWTPEDARRHADEFTANPPIEQQGNLVRVGDKSPREYHFSVQYTIEVPAETEVHATTGSGGVDVNGIGGPITLVAGSGEVRIAGVQHDVRATAGAGNISIAGVEGDVDASTGSGKIEIAGVKGEVRAHAHSGEIDIAGPGGPVTVSGSSGNVELSGVAQDTRVETSSGTITVNGNPTGHSYWELHSSSGAVTLNVPADASFHFLAHSGSGTISSDIPMMAEESSSKHDLRAHLGSGDARVEIRTSSGNIRLQ